MPAITLQGVTKAYRGVAALRGIDLTVERGEVFGFLGPNGAGKSTTIDIVLRYTHPTDGSVEVLGNDVATDPVAVRRRTGVLPEGFAPFETMTGRQHVEYAIEATEADDDPDDLLERVGVAHAADRLASGYSKGMAQRLTLAMALVDDPDLLILDEPSTGLDPHGVRRMREIVREERDRGATVFFSSHILEQVEAVADRVGILNQGQLLTVDTIDGLREGVGAAGELTVTLDPASTEPGATPGASATDGPGQAAVADPVSIAGSIDGVTDATLRGDELVVTCRPEAKLAVLDDLRDGGLAVRDFETDRTSLEDLFVSYTEGTR